jgi:hypothetical protein
VGLGERDGEATEPTSSGAEPTLCGPRSAASVALGRYDIEGAVPRRTAARAEMASLRTQLAHASAQGDTGAELAASTALARALATRGAELDTANKLARRALALDEDGALREQLSGWFAGLGEPALAAATLRPVLGERSGEQAASTLTRIGVLLARSGDAAGAADAFAQAAREQPNDPVALELFGALGAWASEAVAPERAAESYAHAASRREALGERPAAFEDLLRAFEMAPASAVAAERLCAALASRGRVGAADEVRREQARARGERGREVHLRRVQDFAASNDLPRALAAAFDARLESEPDLESALRAAGLSATTPPHPVGFDELLRQAGLHELVAARLEVLCESPRNQQRVDSLLALGRVCSGPLASPDRAVDAWIEALSFDPANDEARGALRAHSASTHDLTPLTEALIRVGLSDAPEQAGARLGSLRELVVLAEQRLGDPALALWAVRRLQAAGVGDSELAATRQRLEPRVRLQDEELAALRAALARVDGIERVALLRRLASLLFGRPDDVDAYLAVLADLARLPPEDRQWRVAFERVCWRTGRIEQLRSLLEEVTARRGGQPEGLRAALTLAAIRRRENDWQGALRELGPGLRGGGAPGTVSSMALLLASRLGDEATRARALANIAASLQPPLRAVLGGVAAETFLAAGDLVAARAAAQQASHADPTTARPHAVLAAVALQSVGQPELEPIERAMSVIVPRASMCAALARAYADAGEHVLAVAWTQRWLALRPSDPLAAEAMLARVAVAADAGRLADALAWVLSQPQPLEPLAPTLATALLRLARLDPARGAALARRTLDVVGPRVLPVRRAVLEVADAIGERGLATTTLERWLASGASANERPELLLDVARRCKAAGDADAAARALARALAEGGDASSVLAELDSALPAETSDGELSLLEARAEALSALADADLGGAALAWRQFGAACWDLAGDDQGAVRAWERAAALDQERGIERLAADLVAFAGPVEALARLGDLFAQRRDPAQQVRVLAAAANVALQAGLRDQALDIAVEGLRTDPSHSGLLAIAERAVSDERLGELVRVYDLVADAALGCFGERAARYRAARQLDRRGVHDEAFRNALAAFEAVPAVGVTFVLAARLAERTGNSTELVRAIERVAARARSEHERASWLERAAKFAGSDEEGKRERVEVLLRALVVRPDVDALRMLGEAVTELVRFHPEDSEIIELRFERAVAGVLSRLDGPDGARAAIEAACVALSTLDSAPLAAMALKQAVRSCADLEEYRRLWELTPRLANAPEPARAVLALMQERSSAKHAAVSREMVELGVRLAHEFDDIRSAASLLVQAALRERDDEELTRRAAQAATESGDPDLLALVVDLVPSGQRSASLLAVLSAADQAEEPEAAIEVLEQVLASRDLDEAIRTQVFDRLRQLYAAVGRSEALESMLMAELERGQLADAARVELVGQLMPLAGAGANAVRALKLAAPVVREHPDDAALVGELVQLARRAEDRRTLVEALGYQLRLTSDPAAKQPIVQELARWLEELQEYPEAAKYWAELLRYDRQAVEALAALERDAQRREDFEALAELLGRHAQAVDETELVQQLRLRRATVLEQQLGRCDEARAELETLLSSTGDELRALRMLADLNQRLGDELRAAPLWLRASTMLSDPEEAAELKQHACAAYLRGGDVVSARRVLGELGEAVSDETVLRLRVEVERASEDPLGLAEALERLAAVASLGAQQRAELLLEAMRAAEAGGDSQRALSNAQGAAALVPHAPGPQLSARLLEYRARGAGSAAEARATVAQLRAISAVLTPEQAELRAFLLAEALEVAANDDVAMRALGSARAEWGLRPLVAVATAERLARAEEAHRSLSLFDAALAGDLRGLRKRGSVAMQAAEIAYANDEYDRALQYLEVAGKENDTRPDALALAAMVRDDLRSADRARQQDDAALVPRADQQAVLGPRPPRPAGRKEQPESAVVESGLPSTLPYPGLVDVVDDNEPIDELDPADLEMLSPGDPSRASARPGSVAEALVAAADAAAMPDRPREQQPQVVGATPATPAPAGSPQSAAPVAGDSAPPPESTDPAHPGFTPASRDEASLLDALARGSVQAGQELLGKLESMPQRSQDLVSVCRRLAVLVPGDRKILEQLHAAAVADHNAAYARCLEHAKAAFVLDAPLPAPPLVHQPEQSERVRALLFRGLLGPAARALALVWKGAGHVFQREPASYQVTGLDRVPHGAATALGRMYSEAARVLGLTRTPLFQRGQAGEVSVSVALLSPPAVIVTGEVREASPQLAFQLGAMLAATLPEYVLVFGSPPEQAQCVLEALSFGFGPPKSRISRVTDVVKLAEVLWQSLPASAQRELREICDEPSRLDYATAKAAASRAVRRAGLFVAGDLAVAVRATCAELGIGTRMLSGPGGLAAACSSSVDVSDIVRLATNPQYAEARWHALPVGRRPPSGMWK